MEQEKPKKSSSKTKKHTTSTDKTKSSKSRERTSKKEKPVEKKGLLDQHVEGLVEQQLLEKKGKDKTEPLINPVDSQKVEENYDYPEELEGAVGGEIFDLGDLHEPIGEIHAPQINDPKKEKTNKQIAQNLEMMAEHEEIIMQNQNISQPTEKNIREQSLIDLSDSNEATRSKPKQKEENTAEVQQSDVEDLTEAPKGAKAKTVSPTKQQENNIIEFVLNNGERIKKYHSGQLLLADLNKFKNNTFRKRLIETSTDINNYIRDIEYYFKLYDSHVEGDDPEAKDILKSHASKKLSDTFRKLDDCILERLKPKITSVDKSDEKRKGLFGNLALGFGAAFGVVAANKIYDRRQKERDAKDERQRNLILRKQGSYKSDKGDYGSLEYDKFKLPSNTKTSGSSASTSSKATGPKGKSMKR